MVLSSSHLLTSGTSLEAVGNIINDLSVRELPDIIPFAVHEHLVDKFVSKWKTICLDSFHEAEELLKLLVERLCKAYFGRFRSSGLLHVVE